MTVDKFEYMAIHCNSYQKANTVTQILLLFNEIQQLAKNAACAEFILHKNW